MMKKLTIAILVSLLAVVARGQFFSASCGNATLYYNVLSPTTVELTYPDRSTVNFLNTWGSYPQPTGALRLPDTVSHDGTIYSVASISNYAFAGCSGLTSVVLPASAVTVGNNAFYGNATLSRVGLPMSLRRIGSSAFRGCSLLDSLMLPSSLDTIAGLAFADCLALRSVVMIGSQPPFVQTTAFNNVPLSQCTLSIPAAADSLYRSTSPWSSFGSFVLRPDACLITVATADIRYGSVAGGGEYPYGTVATLVATPSTGCFFACWSDGDTLNPRTLTALSNTALTAYFRPLIHDTIVALIEVHDTLIDTLRITLHDTVPLPTATVVVASAQPSLGVAAGSAQVPLGTALQLAAIPVEGARFDHWDDGSTANPRTVVVEAPLSLMAHFVPSTSAITNSDTRQWTISARGLSVDVACRAGAVISIFSADGRRLTSLTAVSPLTTFSLPSAGTYLVSIDGMPARKIVLVN